MMLENKIVSQSFASIMTTAHANSVVFHITIIIIVRPVIYNYDLLSHGLVDGHCSVRW